MFIKFNLEIILQFATPKFDFNHVIDTIYTDKLFFTNDNFNILTHDPIKLYMVSCFNVIPLLKNVVLDVIVQHLEFLK